MHIQKEFDVGCSILDVLLFFKLRRLKFHTRSQAPTWTSPVGWFDRNGN